MKKYVILVGIVVALYSCNDMYDNIGDNVEAGKVYPGKFDFAKAKAGNERVEIDLLEAGRIPSSQVNLSKAVETVVEYSDTVVVIDSVCSWVNITGLTLPKLYRFKIYTRDKFGNQSIPVETTCKPFTKEDEAALLIAVPRVTAFFEKIIVVCATNSVLFDYCSLSYSYTDKDAVLREGQLTNPNNEIRLDNLTAGQVIPLNITYKVMPKGVTDTISLVTPLIVKTTTQEIWDAYVALTSPYNGPHYVNMTTPCLIKGYDFDFGGEGKAFHDSNTAFGFNPPYRTDYTAGVPNVDVYTTGGYDCTGGSVAGEWLLYTIDVQDAGTYLLEVNVATDNNNSFHFEVDEELVTGIVPMPNSGGGANYRWNPVAPEPPVLVYLSTGIHKVKYYIESAGGNHNMNAIRLTYKP
ncbi:hypothetical protein AGMMS50239_07440 [Bacteroidia bacterium]|nr:hypothetical protein AGMMS50239_07440 [Bacteroidia bacterium]